jgi:tetratricopeptide (TPR) repeat protein
MTSSPRSSGNRLKLLLILLLALGAAASPPAAQARPRKQPKKAAPVDLRAQAEAHLAAGRLEAARDLFEKAVAAKPDDARALLQLGLLYEKEGRTAKAIDAYEKGFRKGPAGFDRLRVNLGALYNLEGKPDRTLRLLDGRVADGDRDATAHLVLGSAWLATGKPDKALAQFRIVRALEPGSLRGMLAAGSAHRALGQHDQSLALLEGAARAFPNDAAAHFQLAETLAVSGRHARAMGHYRQAEAAGGDPGVIRRRMADVSLAMKDYPTAIATLEGLRKASPADLELAGALAAAYEQAGQPQRAEKELQALVSRQPKSAAARFRLGVVLGIQGRHAEAVAQFRKAQALSPDDPSILRALAVAARRAGDGAAAESAAQRLLKLRPDDVDSTALVAVLLRDRGKPAEAIALYRSFVARHPSDPAALADLAELLDEAGQGTEALAAARRAATAGPTFATAHDRLGWILLRRGDRASALPSLEKASRLSPSEPAILYHYAEALHRNGRPQEALAAVQRALSLSSDFPGARDAVLLRNKLVEAGRF